MLYYKSILLVSKFYVEEGKVWKGVNMENQVLNYLKQTVDKDASVYVWDAKKMLNFHMAGGYDFYEVSVLGVFFLLIKPLETITIQKTKIQMEHIKNKTGFDIAVLLENSTSYRTKKMLEERIPFISVDKQMYLPFMALHIRKQQENRNATEVHEKFTAATQLLYLYMLYHENNVFDTEELSQKLNISVMTVLRGMKELEQIGLVHYEVAGQTRRKKIFKSIDKKAYYSLGRTYLQNPIKNIIYVKNIPQSVEAYKGGLYALSEQTMLGEPTHEVYAVDSKQGIKLFDFMVTKLQALEEGLPEVQLMKYNIGLLTRRDCIDPITLITSLNEKDERIDIAISEMMEGIEWFEE